MEWSRRIRLVVIWSVLTAALITGFLGIHHLIAGSVPETEIVILGERMFFLSRWWDILLGPIYSITFISVFTSEKAYNELLGKDNSGLGFPMNLASGIVLFLSIFCIASFGIIGGVVCILIECFFIIFIFSSFRLFSSVAWEKTWAFLLAKNKKE